MSAPGVGIQDIVNIISKCKDIYTAFAGEYDSAPQRVQELVDTCTYLTNVFSALAVIDGAGAGGVPQELHRTFARKLEECNSFIKTYHALKKDYLNDARSATLTGRLVGAWKTTWQTGRYAFEGKKAKELRDALDLETGKLLLFVMTSMRCVPCCPNPPPASGEVLTQPAPRDSTRGSNVMSLSTTTWGGAAHTPGYDPTWIKSMFMRLQLISNRYEREMSRSAQLLLPDPAHEHDLSDLSREVYGVWNEFCERAGLPPASRPQLPGNWLAAPVRSRNDAVLNATRPSAHLYGLPRPGRAETLVSEPDLLAHSPSFTTISDRNFSTTSLAETFPSTNPTTPSMPPSNRLGPTTPAPPLPHDSTFTQSMFNLMPPPEFYQAKAYVAFGPGRGLKLKEWRVDRSDSRPKLIWTAETPPGVLEHIRKCLMSVPPAHGCRCGRLASVGDTSPGLTDGPLLTVPKDVFPETLHSSLDKARRVGFSQHKPGDEGHLLHWKPEVETRSGGGKSFSIVPKYQFMAPDACEARRVFQSDVRDKDLTGVFDTDVIWTDRTDTRQDKRESLCQDLKMWRGRTGEQSGCYSLSFNVTYGVHKNHHVECELRRFEPAARTKGRDHADTVYLDFTAGDGDRSSHSTAATDEPQSSPGSPTTGFGGLGRRVSGMFSKSPAPAERSRASRASFASQRSLPLVAEDDFFANLRFLAVKFSEMEEANGQGIEAASKG
jgi:hypothetical protein